MNIAFLSSLNPNDQNNWSGTLYYLYTSLQKKHRVIWVGGTTFAEVWEFHKANFKGNEAFFPENYALLFGKLVSNLLKKNVMTSLYAEILFFPHISFRMYHLFILEILHFICLTNT